MICTIYRHKRKKDGKVIMARLYRGRFRLDGETETTEVPLKTADKRMAQQRLEQLIRERQMEREGLIAPQEIREAAQSDLSQHLNSYVADLAALNSNWLEALARDRKGQYSIRINEQWRICFRWAKDEPGPANVEIVDYH